MGFHNWEYIKTTDPESVRFYIQNPNATCKIMTEGAARSLFQRICLDCEKYEDTISSFIESVKSEIIERTHRQELAKQLLSKRLSNEN